MTYLKSKEIEVDTLPQKYCAGKVSYNVRQALSVKKEEVFKFVKKRNGKNVTFPILVLFLGILFVELIK